MTLMSVIVAFLFAISLWYLSSNHKVTFVKLKATNLKFLPNRGWHGLIPAGGTFVSATGGTFQSDTPGTFVSAMGGTFDSDIPGTFESATGGTFNPLLSPVALNNANHCDIDVYGDHMHRCVFLCGDHNIVNARGRNYYATAAPAHIILFSNVLKNDKGEYKIVTCNHNNVTYKQLEGETENLNDGAVFQFQGLGLNLNNNIPHEDYSFVGNTVNLYCCKLESKNMQLLYKSFASNWVYDKNVSVECVFNIYGDISSYLSYASFEFYADTEDKITVNNYTDQQLVYTFSYSGNPKSVYEINGNSRSRAFGTKEYPFRGTLRAKGKHVYVDTTTGNPAIIGHIYVEGNQLEVIQDKKAHSKHVHINKRTYR